MPAISAGVSTRRPTARSGTGKALVRSETDTSRAVGVLAQDVVVAQARLGDGVAADRRDVAGLLPEQALVRIAEERDRPSSPPTIDDVPQRRRFAGPVRVDDALDLLGDEVRARTGRRCWPRPASSAGRRGRRWRRRRHAADLGSGGLKASSLLPSVPPRASGAVSASFDESVRITVRDARSSGAVAAGSGSCR